MMNVITFLFCTKLIRTKKFLKQEKMRDGNIFFYKLLMSLFTRVKWLWVHSTKLKEWTEKWKIVAVGYLYNSVLYIELNFFILD